MKKISNSTIDYNHDIYIPARLVDPLIIAITDLEYDVKILKFDTNSLGETRLTIVSKNWEYLHIVVGFARGFIANIYNKYYQG
jgi:hypothetical protein